MGNLQATFIGKGQQPPGVEPRTLLDAGLFTFLYFHLITFTLIYFQLEARCSEHQCAVLHWMPKYIVSEVDRHPDLAVKRVETPGCSLVQTMLNMLPNYEESEHH